VPKASEGSRPRKLGEVVAYAIKRDIAELGWPVGEVLGNQETLMRRYLALAASAGLMACSQPETQAPANAEPPVIPAAEPVADTETAPAETAGLPGTDIHIFALDWVNGQPVLGAPVRRAVDGTRDCWQGPDTCRGPGFARMRQANLAAEQHLS